MSVRPSPSESRLLGMMSSLTAGMLELRVPDDQVSGSVQELEQVA